MSSYKITKDHYASIITCDVVTREDTGDDGFVFLIEITDKFRDEFSNWMQENNTPTDTPGVWVGENLFASTNTKQFTGFGGDLIDERYLYLM